MAYSEKHPSGAKAHVDFAAFTARLKSCPVTKPLHTKNEIALDGVNLNKRQKSPIGFEP
jgi:hypothetical protein